MTNKLHSIILALAITFTCQSQTQAKKYNFFAHHIQSTSQATKSGKTEVYHLVLISPDFRDNAFAYHNQPIEKKRNKLIKKKKYQKHPEKLISKFNEKKYRLKETAYWDNSKDVQIIALPGGLQHTTSYSSYSSIDGYSSNDYTVSNPNSAEISDIKVYGDNNSLVCKAKKYQRLNYAATKSYIWHHYISDFKDLPNLANQNHSAYLITVSKPCIRINNKLSIEIKTQDGKSYETHLDRKILDRLKIEIERIQR